MNNFSQDMIYIFVYMDDLVIISDDTYKNHMDILDDVLKHLENQGARQYS